MKNVIKCEFALIFLLLFGIISAQSKYSSMTDKKGNNLVVQMDLQKGTVHRIYGLKTNISEYKFDIRNLSKTSIKGLSNSIFTDYKDILKTNTSSYKLKKVDNEDDMWFVSYLQTEEDIPIYNTELGYTLNKQGNVILLGGNYYNNVDVSTIPKISVENAIQIAKNFFNVDSCLEKEKAELIIYPMEDDSKYQFYLTWKIFLSSITPLKEEVIFVSAENGEIIHSFSNIMESSVSGTVTGGYWPQHYYDNSVSIGLPTTNIRIYSVISYNWIATINTNSSGYYYYSLGSSVYNIYFDLQNNYVRIRNSSGNVVSTYYTFVPTATVNKNWGATNGSNVRWHANIIHDYFKNTFSYNSMDYQMEGYVDQGTVTNGAANGTDIFFGSQNNQYWARSSDVIYHEYTHNVVYHIYGGWIGSPSQYYTQATAMDEGLSDYFACTKNNDDIQGESVGVSRDLSNTYSWNPNLGAHLNGRVIGGACWDVRVSVGNTISDKLTFRALQITPHAHNFEDFLSNMIIADNEYYSSAHYNQITNAFANHNIIQYEQVSSSMEILSKQQPDNSSNYETNLAEIPLENKLTGNYPNPFNPSSTINYQLKEGGFVSLKVYDILGKEITTLVDENKGAGYYSVDFNAIDLPSGIYFYRIKVKNYIATKKMLLVK